MPDRRFSPRPRWSNNQPGRVDERPAANLSRIAVRPGYLVPFRNRLWVSMYKFSGSVVVWAFVLYWLLSEYTNILA